MFRQLRCCLLLVLFSIVLCSCGRSVNKAQKKIASSDRSCIEGIKSDTMYAYEFCKDGVIYRDGNHFRYKEYTTGTSYILCGDANCRHNSDSCLAFDSGNKVFGFCYYRDFLYEFRMTKDAEKLQLLKINLESNQTKVLCDFETGSYEPGNRVFENIGSLLFSGKYVWISMEYCTLLPYEQQYSDTGATEIESFETEYLGINLESGEKVLLFDRDSKYDRIQYAASSDKYVILTCDYYDKEELSQGEFNRLFRAGEYREYESDVIDPYLLYKCSFHCNAEKTEDIVVYSIEQGEMSAVRTEVMHKEIFPFDENIQDASFYAPYIIYAIMDDCLYYSKESYLSDSVYEEDQFLIRYSLPDGQEENIYDMKNSAVVLTNTYNYLSSPLMNGTELLMGESISEEECKLYFLDLHTLDRTELFTDVSNITFRPSAETETMYLGQMLVNNDVGLYQISKEDFCTGNLSAAKKMILNV